MDKPIFPFLDKSDLSDKMQAAFERSLENIRVLDKSFSMAKGGNEFFSSPIEVNGRIQLEMVMASMYNLGKKYTYT